MAARDHQAFELPASLRVDELAAAAFEAQYYGLSFLHDLCNKACQRLQLHAQYDYKYVLDYSLGHNWQPTEETLQQLHAQGWDVWQCSTYGGNQYGGVVFVLRRPRSASQA